MNAPVSSEASNERNNLDVLMRVTLQLTAELGTCTMSVAEVLELGSGSIVELDRKVDEPIDLHVNGRVVARGEVVAIEDNFGVRVTDLIQGAP
jgi:flagellar motor switch protein FliN/FliY